MLLIMYPAFYMTKYYIDFHLILCNNLSQIHDQKNPLVITSVMVLPKSMVFGIHGFVLERTSLFHVRYITEEKFSQQL